MEMEKKDLQRMESEIFTMISEIKGHTKINQSYIADMIESGAPGPMEDEIRAIEIEAKELIKAQEDLDDFSSFNNTEEEILSLKSEIEGIMKETLDLANRLDEFAERFYKYNVPRLHKSVSSESLENYGKLLREFMQIWKAEAKKGREKGDKSLIEWLRLLDQSDVAGRKTTFHAMRLVLVDLGIKISDYLGSYLLLMSVSLRREEMEKNLKEFATVIGCLSVEENSIVINMFLSITRYINRAIWMKGVQFSSRGLVTQRKIETNLLHLIVREVLRLEVAFCCPDLPMMLTNDVFLSMGAHLRRVFDQNLDPVAVKVNDLALELRPNLQIENRSKMKFVKKVFDMGIPEIWSTLDLQPDSVTNLSLT